MGKGKDGKGKGNGIGGKGKGKGKGNARSWHRSTCNFNVAGDYCSSCGVKWVFGAVLRDRADSPTQQGKRALGRKPQFTDTSKSPTYRDKLLQPASNSTLEAVLEKLDKLEKQNSLRVSSNDTDSSGGKGADAPGSKGIHTAPNVVKPLPGREVFVDFDGKPCNLDDLNAMLRPTVRTLGNDSHRAGEIREAIDRAHTKRQGQMEPQARIEYLEKILCTKAKEAEQNDTEIQQCQDEISALSAKMERLRSKGAQVATDVDKIKQDILAASAEVGDADTKPVFTAKRSDILQKPLFRQWLLHNKPEVHEFQEDTGWCTISDKLLLRFRRYEVHCLRVSYNLGRIMESIPSPERSELERKTMESVNWMLEVNEFFPDELQSFKDGLLEDKANPFQADNANLFTTRKRDGGGKADEVRQKKKKVMVSGPYLIPTDGGVEALEIDEAGVLSYDVVLEQAASICQKAGKTLFDKDYISNLMYSIDEENEEEAEAAKAFLLAIVRHAKLIERFPVYDEYWKALQVGLDVPA